MVRSIAAVVAAIAFILAGSGCGGGDDTAQICEPQEKKCDGNDIVKCTGDGSDWAFFKTCEDGCADGECKKAASVCEFEGMKTTVFAPKPGEDWACGTGMDVVMEFGNDGSDPDCKYQEDEDTCTVHVSCFSAELGMTMVWDYTAKDGQFTGTFAFTAPTTEGGILKCTYSISTEDCESGTVDCDSDGRVIKCNANGGWDVVVACPEECSEGVCVAARSGPCVVGESAGYTQVRIEDDLTNATLEPPSCGGGSPGADIDAVCLYMPDGSEKGCAVTAVVEPAIGVECQNDHDDPNEVLGAPDGISQSGLNVGYYSLSGGAVVLTYGLGAEILCGDSIHVWEMYNPDVPGSQENYKVSLGTYDGIWNIASDWATGENDIDVTWEW